MEKIGAILCNALLFMLLGFNYSFLNTFFVTQLRDCR